MDYLNNNISLNLKKIRLARGISLDSVAEQTGVSKSMLGQIERGVANPTIGILGKIVSGLRVELNDLIRTPGDEIYPVFKERLIPTKEEKGRYRVYTYFPYDKDRNFELYVIEIEAGCSYFSGSHGENTKEYIIVEEGSLTLEVGGEKPEEIVVNEGDAVRIDTDKDHKYSNNEQKRLQFLTVFSYSA